MKPVSYRLIFILISLIACIILCIQLVWVSYNYKLSKQEVRKDALVALSRVGKKLQQRESVSVISKDLLKGINIPEWQGKENVKIQVNTNNGVGAIRITRNESTYDTIKNIEHIDSVVKISGNKKIVMVNSSISTESDSGQINPLLFKMITEVENLGATDLDSLKTDTVASIIRKELLHSGINPSFEFELSNTKKGEEKTICKSNSYQKKEDNLSLEISGDRIFSRGIYLNLQLNDSMGNVLEKMKNILWLSGILTVLLLIVLYITVRGILNQKRLSEIRVDFVNNVTHELKTPIATVSLALDAMNNPLIRNNPEKLNYYINLLKEENLKLGKHVEQVLEMSVAEEKNNSESKSLFSINEIINKSVLHFELQAKEKKATINLNLCGEVSINAIQNQIQNAINNLIDNAIKYGFENNTITIETFHDKTYLTIKITDKGKGINKEEQERIFEKFYRGSTGNLHDVKGFGLGLSYVKKVAENHSGSVSLMSEPGQGTSFFLKIKMN